MTHARSLSGLQICGSRGPEAARSCPALAAAYGSPQRSAPPAAPITYGIMAVIESVTVVLKVTESVRQTV